MNILPIATGITSFFGVLGLIIYLIYRIQYFSTKTILTPELVNALRKTGVKARDAKELSIKKLKTLLESKTSISSKLIDQMLKPEVAIKIRLFRIITMISFILTIFFSLIIFLQHSIIPNLKEQNNRDTKIENPTLKAIEDTIKIDSIVGINIKEYELTIITQPEYANIYLSNKFVGLSNKTFKVKPGNYIIQITKSGYNNFNDIVEIPQQSLISIDLEQ